MMRTWLAQHSKGCGGKPLTIFDPNNPDPNNHAVWLTPARLAPYDVIILLDVKHNDADLQRKIAGNYEDCNPEYCGVGNAGYGGNMRDMTTTGEATVLANWVKNGGGLATIVGLANWPGGNEVNFANQALAGSGLQYSTTAVSILAGTDTISGTWGGSNLFGFRRDSLGPTGLASVITNNVNLLRVTHGYEVLLGVPDSGSTHAYARGYASSRIAWNPTKYSALEYRTIGAAGNWMSGRVNVWGDEWITYDAVWGDLDQTGHSYDAAAYWQNSIKWLGQCP